MLRKQHGLTIFIHLKIVYAGNNKLRHHQFPACEFKSVILFRT